MEIELSWPVESLLLKQCLWVGEWDALFSLGQVCTPGSIRWSQHVTTCAETGMARGVAMTKKKVFSILMVSYQWVSAPSKFTLDSM